MESPLDIILQRLESVEQHDGYVTALCPTHDDNRASLSISEARDGKVLLKCHAGCATEDVVAALGMSMQDLFPTSTTNGLHEPKPMSKLGRIVETYDYTDEHGTVLFQTVRFEPKKFRQRHHDPAHPKAKKGGWVWSLKGCRRVLYRLQCLAPAIGAGEIIYLVEGEKDVHAMEALGLTATTCPMGAGKGKWRPEYSESLQEAHVVILPDNDKAGRDLASAAAQSLHSLASEVKMVHLPGLAEKGDVSDWLATGGTLEALQQLAEETPLWDSSQLEEKATTPTDKEEGREERVSTATMVVQLVIKEAEPFAADHTMLFVRRNRDGQNLLLDSDAFRYYAADLYLNATGKALPSAAFTDALPALKGQAIKNEHTVYVRTGGDLTRRVVYLNLGTGRIACITPEAITIERAEACAARFWEPGASQALPDPDLSGTLEDLGEILDLTGPALLIAAGWLLTTLLPDGPYPVLAVFGPQGAGKSTRCRHLTRLLDPSRLLLRTLPRSEDDLIIAARSGHILTYDNLSKISEWLSDALCRLATGGGLEKRALYTNLDSIVISVKRPVIINAIVDVVSRSDLADRLMLLELPRMAARRTERTIEMHFEKRHAKALGAILKGVQAALATFDEMALPELPRMADACTFAEAGLRGLGAEPLAFYRAYTEAHAGANRAIIEADFLGSLIATLASRDGFTGTATELLKRLELMAEGQTKNLPSDATRLSSDLRRLDPALRSGYGVEVEFTRSATKREIIVHPVQVEKSAEHTASSASSASQMHGNGSTNDADDASDAISTTIQNGQVWPSGSRVLLDDGREGTVTKARRGDRIGVYIGEGTTAETVYASPSTLHALF